MKHTPGPWKIDSYNLNVYCAGGLLAKVYGHLINGERHANANLIAAAPEMLGELEFLIDHCLEIESRQYSDGKEYEVEVIRAGYDGVKRIRTLIAKAKGGI